MSANYSHWQIPVEFTHEGLVIGKIFDFLPMKIDSRAKTGKNYP